MLLSTFATLSVLLAFSPLSKSSVRFTNLQCKHFHPEFATFTKCRLQLVKRATVAMNIHVKLLQVPVKNISMNLSLHKKENGYRPFLYNLSLDFCKFQRNRKQLPFAKLFFDVLLKDSNINHTCPYDHDIIVKDLILREDMFKYIPLPAGDYMFQLIVGAYNDWKADVKAYANVDLSFSQ